MIFIIVTIIICISQININGANKINMSLILVIVVVVITSAAKCIMPNLTMDVITNKKKKFERVCRMIIRDHSEMDKVMLEVMAPSKKNFVLASHATQHIYSKDKEPLRRVCQMMTCLIDPPLIVNMVGMTLRELLHSLKAKREELLHVVIVMRKDITNSHVLNLLGKIMVKKSTRNQNGITNLRLKSLNE